MIHGLMGDVKRFFNWQNITTEILFTRAHTNTPRHKHTLEGKKSILEFIRKTKQTTISVLHFFFSYPSCSDSERKAFSFTNDSFVFLSILCLSKAEEHFRLERLCFISSFCCSKNSFQQKNWSNKIVINKNLEIPMKNRMLEIADTDYNLFF